MGTLKLICILYCSRLGLVVGYSDIKLSSNIDLYQTMTVIKCHKK